MVIILIYYMQSGVMVSVRCNASYMHGLRFNAAHTIPKMTSLQMGHDLTAESPSQSFREGGTAGGLNKLSLVSVGGRLKDGLGR